MTIIRLTNETPSICGIAHIADKLNETRERLREEAKKEPTTYDPWRVNTLTLLEHEAELAREVRWQLSEMDPYGFAARSTYQHLFRRYRTLQGLPH